MCICTKRANYSGVCLTIFDDNMIITGLYFIYSFFFADIIYIISLGAYAKSPQYIFLVTVLIIPLITGRNNE